MYLNDIKIIQIFMYDNNKMTLKNKLIPVCYVKGNCFLKNKANDSFKVGQF